METKKRRLGRVEVKNSKLISGSLKGHNFLITKAKDKRGNIEIYCTVIAESGCYAVDGYFTGSDDINDALQWAIEGACL